MKINLTQVFSHKKDTQDKFFDGIGIRQTPPWGMGQKISNGIWGWDKFLWKRLQASKDLLDK